MEVPASQNQPYVQVSWSAFLNPFLQFRIKLLFEELIMLDLALFFYFYEDILLETDTVSN